MEPGDRCVRIVERLLDLIESMRLKLLCGRGAEFRRIDALGYFSTIVTVAAVIAICAPRSGSTSSDLAIRARPASRQVAVGTVTVIVVVLTNQRRERGPRRLDLVCPAPSAVALAGRS
jgi:hypothetical protein